MLTPIIALQLYLTKPVFTKPSKPKTAVVAPVVLTEADNPQHCDENLYWIASEKPYYCIRKNASITSGVPASDNTNNLYEPGQCVYGVKMWRPEIPNWWGDADQWFGNAQASGWPVGYTPRVNAVGASIFGNHVVLVLAVYGDGTILLKEMNYNYIPWSVRDRVAYASDFRYIY